MTLQQAIARQEGFGIAGTRATLNHNPGNIRYGTFAKLHGATDNDGAGYAVFPDDATGEAALTALLSNPPYKGLTVTQALNKYAPAGDGNAPQIYIDNVCGWCPCTPSTVIDGLLG
jgi:hypothetical protein